jgi:hypothetical protein
MEFEYYAMDVHSNLYGHRVWHITEAPKDVLEEAGILHAFNKERALTWAKRRAAKGSSVLFDDYGVDFIAQDINTNDPTFHACQVKYYRTQVVRARDISTFLLVMLSQVKSTGYLYTINGLERRLLENIPNMVYPIVHHRLDFE